jgi:ABC-type multidrug transport system fused ATPase/permease subunit
VNAYRALLKDLVKRLKWRFPVLLVWTALVGLSEGMSIILLLPILDRIGVSFDGGQSFVIRAIDGGLRAIGASSICAVLLVIIAVATVQMILSVALNFWTVHAARSYQSQRQVELFASFMGAKWIFLVDQKSGEMANAIITECERLGRAFTLSLSLLSSVLIVLIFVSMSALVAWAATLTIVGLALVSGLAMFRMYEKTFSAGGRLALLNAQLQSFLTESFGAAKLIKASSAIERAAVHMKSLVQELADANIITTAMPGTVRCVIEYAALVGVAVILVVATSGFGMAPASVIIVVALFARLFPRITALQSQLHSLNNNVHAVKIVNELQAAAEVQAERQDLSRARRPLVLSMPTSLEVAGLEVTFRGRKALEGVNVRLPIPGFVAIVGSSGAGKSTLVHTLLGLTEPAGGSIRLGHFDLASTALSAWRGAIGYVPQETILFHASIRDNLTFCHATATDEEVKLAARRAHAHDFIMALPDGYETIVGDQGMKLSGGQRQRLGIARALLVNPVLLVLDEAMSALDAESEREILSTLEELRTQMGILMIAHRLAAVSSADLIYVLQEGRVAESGTWDDLMARNGRLHALAGAQGLDRVTASAH